MTLRDMSTASIVGACGPHSMAVPTIEGLKSSSSDTLLGTVIRRQRSLSFDIESLHKSRRHLTNMSDENEQPPVPMNRSKSALVSQSSILLHDGASSQRVIGTGTGTSGYFSSSIFNNGNSIDGNKQVNDDDNVDVKSRNNGANGPCQRSSWSWRKLWLKERSQIVVVHNQDNTVSVLRVATAV